MSGPADVVGSIALLYDELAPRVTPDALVEAFCPRVEGDSEVTTASGFCGFTGGKGHGFEGGVGYDDGYDFLADLTAPGRGWAPVPEKGDWPYVVVIAYPAKPPDVPALAQYCEADLTVWRGPALALKAIYRDLRDCP